MTAVLSSLSLFYCYSDLFCICYVDIAEFVAGYMHYVSQERSNFVHEFSIFYSKLVSSNLNNLKVYVAVRVTFKLPSAAVNRGLYVSFAPRILGKPSVRF